MKTLFEELTEYSESNILPCHMPGHKRKSFGDLPEDFVKIDLTEVEGTDNLHEPAGILKDAQDRAALLCHARKTFFLVGGSTAGILAAISAAVPAGGTILLPRGCHRSVYHALYLRRITPAYLETELTTCGIPEPPSPEEVEERLVTCSEAAAVLITCPTYEGRLTKVRRIAEMVHAAGKILIVDEAHGAHLGWSSALPESAAQAGADLVIQSTHKTLPAPTQTALLHLCSDRVSEERIRRFLRIYETSSPSYPLMAGIDNALSFMEKEGDARIRALNGLCAELQQRLKDCKKIRLMPASKVQDPGKVLILCDRAGVGGKQLSEILRRDYRIETEMSAPEYVLAMMTVADDAASFTRLGDALLDIDRRLALSAGGENEGKILPDTPQYADDRQEDPADRIFHACENALAEECGEPALPEVILPLWQAWDAKAEEISIEEAEGRICGEFVCPYPPGTPILLPGERIRKRDQEVIRRSVFGGAEVNGIRTAADPNGKVRIYLPVVVQ